MVAIEPPEPTPEEQLQLKVEMDRLIKSLPERKRRTFMRFMKKGKEVETVDDEGNFLFSFLLNDSTICFLYLDGSNLNDETTVKETVRIPHSRTDLLNKFELLKVAQDDDEDDDQDSGSDNDFEDASFSDESS